MPTFVTILRAVCALLLCALGIVMALNEAWVGCLCITIVAWDNRPGVFKKSARMLKRRAGR